MPDNINFQVDLIRFAGVMATFVFCAQIIFCVSVQAHSETFSKFL